MFFIENDSKPVVKLPLVGNQVLKMWPSRAFLLQKRRFWTKMTTKMGDFEWKSQNGFQSKCVARFFQNYDIAPKTIVFTKK